MNIEDWIENFLVDHKWKDGIDSVLPKKREGDIYIFFSDVIKDYCHKMGCESVRVENTVTDVHNGYRYEGVISLAFLYRGEVHLMTWMFYE